LTYLTRGIEKTLFKRNQKLSLLASVRAGSSEPPHGMTVDEAVTILVQDIADFDAVLSSLRGHGIAGAAEGR
jgi:hypothetical protein